MTRNTSALITCLLLCIASFDARAGRPVRVYEVDLKGGQTPTALQNAMRDVLVRATGRRESATDPALAGIISGAESYVKSYTSPSKAQPQVIFDGAAVERAIVAAGRSTWDPVRPFTLVVLYPSLPRAAEEAARTELDQAAIARGLPITVVPLSPLDPSGNELPRDALMQMAQRYGGDAVLIGRSDAGTANGQMQWTLNTSFSSESWSGPLSAGINGAVDNMAPAQAGSLSQIEASARVEINGVATLTDYVNVQRLLESAPGVRRVNVGAARGNMVVFDVVTRGGGDALSHALTGTGHLAQQEASSARLAYQYRP
jgi:hypothetical protein